MIRTKVQEMPDAKVNVELGSFVFSGEGSEEWLSTQLDKVLTKLEEFRQAGLIKDSVLVKDGKENPNVADNIFEGARNLHLAQFLKKYSKDQRSKCLATAAWLQLNGKDGVKNHDVTKALADNKQPRLSNASKFLAECISKGDCVKKGELIHVTGQGYQTLGLVKSE